MAIERELPPALAAKLCNFALCGVSAGFILLYVGIALSRIAYPFELEWLEGLSLQHVKQVFGEGALYVRPTIDFVPNLYPPLHAYLGAIVCQLFGTGFASLRAISFLSSIGVLLLIHRFVARETGTPISVSNVPAMFAAGLFAATFDRVGGWFDIARIDSLYLLFAMVGFYIARFYPSPRGLVLAGLAFVAAGFVKQTGFMIAVPLMVALIYCYGIQGAWFSASLGVVAAVCTLVLAFLYEGSWFFYYVIEMPMYHPKVMKPSMDIIWNDVFAAMPVASLLALVALLSRDLLAPPNRRLILGAFLVGGLGVSWMVRSRVGSFVNDIIPAYLALSICAGVGLERFQRTLLQRGHSWVISTGVVIASLIQFAMFAYDPIKHIPTAQDQAAGENIVRQLRELPGEVFLPHHGYLAEMAGKRSFAHTLAIDNLRLEDRGPNREFLERQIIEGLARKRFGAVILESDGWSQSVILEHYRPLRPLNPQSGVFIPKEGGKIRPELILVPK